ncbi:SDR family NAD(P)-dependent oxidoreductase [Arenicella sp. 4NH20-0111]|uniref:SDR family NAD(P)-dependent oxidoreductase n=1 Tax=Arenicella sp. 4NH20-0111 TaxID=3127648 RepID=UPI0031050713
MNIYQGKTAVISGGAEGIGYSIAEALGNQGMNLVIADIDEQKLLEAESKLKEKGYKVLSSKMDVTDPAQWKNTANQTIERFGKIHMVVNNAGVASAPGPIEKTNAADWRWVVDVNLMGVIYGAEAMIPHIKEHGEGGWMINTASMAGMHGVPYAGAYTATKVAVVGMSESWEVELAKHDIHVSVLCPAFVQTRIHLSGRNRQDDYQDKKPEKSEQDNAKKSKNTAKELVENGIAPEIVGERVVEALNAKEFYIFTHPSHRENLAMRAARIDKAFANAASSPLLKDIEDQGPIDFM